MDKKSLFAFIGFYRMSPKSWSCTELYDRTGTIDEKIYQRQLTKLGLSDCLFNQDGQNDENFLPDDLKDIFNLDDETDCQTHDLLGCCAQLSSQTVRLDDDVKQDEEWVHVSKNHSRRLSEWQNLDCIMSAGFTDALFKTVSFVFFKETAALLWYNRRSALLMKLFY